MQNIHDMLEQIIDNLLLIKNNSNSFSSIEKDILLQNLREAYLLILRQPVMDESQVVVNQKEKSEEVQDNTVKEAVVEEKEVIHEEAQPAEENEEMDTDILEFVKVFEDTNFEEKTPKEPERDLFTESAEEQVETEPLTIEEPEPVVVPEPEHVVVPEPEPIVVEPEVVKPENPEPVEETLEPEPISEPVKVVEPEPVVVPEPEPIVVEPEVVKPENPEPVEETLEPEPIPEPVKVVEPEPVKVVEPEPKVEEKNQQRSLNDLFNEQKQDLGEKFQQTKITDLTKAMSINDKFLFIRELFKNKSEEFSHAIHTLNNCENIEEAFDIMEGLKKQYFWDSTSSAYLALCDLVRRKF